MRVFLLVIFVSGCSIYRATEEEYQGMRLIAEDMEKRMLELEKSHAALEKDEKKREELRDKWRTLTQRFNDLKVSFHRLQKPHVLTKALETVLQTMYDKK